MTEIQADRITRAVADMCLEASYGLAPDVLDALKAAARSETSTTGTYVIETLIDNDRVAREERIALCQDTGIAVFFVELGQELIIAGGLLEDAIQEGVRKAYRDGFLRMSIARDPLFDRSNTGDNTPAVIHTDVVQGSELRIAFMPKGGGSENMGAVAMLTPAAGVHGVKIFVLEQVRRAGANACPPFAVVGVGVGGTMDLAALLSKKALFREIGRPHCDERVASLERELLGEINATGIGPAGLGGTMTALAVHLETYPTHITSLPVAVSFLCNAGRRASVVLKGDGD